MPRREPRRTCVGCRAEREKGEMIRIVRNADGVTALDPSGKADGRGAYLCASEACLEQAVKRKALERALKGPVPVEVVSRLREALENR